MSAIAFHEMPDFDYIGPLRMSPAFIELAWRCRASITRRYFIFSAIEAARFYIGAAAMMLFRRMAEASRERVLLEASGRYVTRFA